MKEQMPVGFLINQINHVYEKDFNNRLRRSDQPCI